MVRKVVAAGGDEEEEDEDGDVDLCCKTGGRDSGVDGDDGVVDSGKGVKGDGAVMTWRCKERVLWTNSLGCPQGEGKLEVWVVMCMCGESEGVAVERPRIKGCLGGVGGVWWRDASEARLSQMCVNGVRKREKADIAKKNGILLTCKIPRREKIESQEEEITQEVAIRPFLGSWSLEVASVQEEVVVV
ncbi:hypothetical protein C8F04DRAFT_1189449 [Mycena alexandri]|uniref:Uncharacterized protein n=1 Tax=Mycena alexandri TaxID=1745969 RepID=A0AAD6SGD1_9AGAR|nr:hypothetical protein C8F04DRAFT_1189449 [Mycena alexandri]